jgi:hypothetical protein
MSGNVPGSSPEPGPADASRHHCQWCSAPTPPGAIRCPACGASLAERESLGGVQIPGVTEVDPQLIYAEQQTARLARKNAALGTFDSDSGLGSGIASTLAGGLAPRSAFGQILGAAAMAIAASSSKDHIGVNPIGDPSGAALQLAAKLDRGEIPEASPTGEDAPPGPGPEAVASGADPWAGLPPVVVQETALPNQLTKAPGAPGPNELTFSPDPWAGASDPWAGASDPWSVGAQATGDPWATSNGPWSNPGEQSLTQQPEGAGDSSSATTDGHKDRRR